MCVGRSGGVNPARLGYVKTTTLAEIPKAAWPCACTPLAQRFAHPGSPRPRRPPSPLDQTSQLRIAGSLPNPFNDELRHRYNVVLSSGGADSAILQIRPTE